LHLIIVFDGGVNLGMSRAAYEDKGGLSVLSEKVQNVPLPEDGVEGAVLEDLSVTWIEQTSASSMEVMDVMTDTSIGPRDAYVLGNDVAIKVVALVLQIMPVLQELCGESSMVVLIKLGSLQALEVAMTPSSPPSEHFQPPAFVDSGVLAPSSEALFVKELCDLLVDTSILHHYFVS
jgi:hypothetical protein